MAAATVLQSAAGGGGGGSGGMHHRGNARSHHTNNAVTVTRTNDNHHSHHASKTNPPHQPKRGNNRTTAKGKQGRVSVCSVALLLLATAIVSFWASFLAASAASRWFATSNSHGDAASTSEHSVNSVVAGGLSSNSADAVHDGVRHKKSSIFGQGGLAGQNYARRRRNLDHTLNRERQDVRMREHELREERIQGGEEDDANAQARASRQMLLQKRVQLRRIGSHRVGQQEEDSNNQQHDMQHILQQIKRNHEKNPRYIMPRGEEIEMESTHEPRGALVRLDTMTDARRDHSVDSTVVPFVIMVFKRVDYLVQVMDSIRASDFPTPRTKVPIVISHDGRVPDVVEYVESLKDEFQIVQLFHPYSCYDHPDSFPGNDTSLNVGYEGDSYGHPRSGWATCCKHHFTWMINQVFKHEQLKDYDSFFFTEEDYIIARRFYSSMCVGLNLMAELEPDTYNGFFGLTFDITNGAKPFLPSSVPANKTFAWAIKTFKTGPMVINRKAWDIVFNHSKDYCSGYDEYNWDWTLQMLMTDRFVPKSTLLPFKVPLVQHIGAKGMHTSEHISLRDIRKRGGIALLRRRFHDFHAFLEADFRASTALRKTRLQGRREGEHKPSGGWNHPKDHEHCEAQFA